MSWLRSAAAGDASRDHRRQRSRRREGSSRRRREMTRAASRATRTARGTRAGATAARTRRGSDRGETRGEGAAERHAGPHPERTWRGCSRSRATARASSPTSRRGHGIPPVALERGAVGGPAAPAGTCSAVPSSGARRVDLVGERRHASGPCSSSWVSTPDAVQGRAPPRAGGRGSAAPGTPACARSTNPPPRAPARASPSADRVDVARVCRSRRIGSLGERAVRGDAARDHRVGDLQQDRGRRRRAPARCRARSARTPGCGPCAPSSREAEPGT